MLSFNHLKKALTFENIILESHTIICSYEKRKRFDSDMNEKDPPDSPISLTEKIKPLKMSLPLC
jgi:hypothetical protein